LLRVLTENTQVPRAAAHRRRLIAFLASLACVMTALFAPALASAAVYVVTGTGDGETAEACEEENAECTLRGAIEAVDVGTGNDEIEFGPEFNGVAGADEIVLTEELPPITQSTTIFGNAIVGGPYDVPNAGVTAPSGKAALQVEAADVTVENVAFNGGSGGIEVLNASTGFKANGNWFGLTLAAATKAIAGPGILLGPGSNGAVIGEGNEGGRNVFTHGTYGVFLKGASQAEIRGNYIGVGPAGNNFASLGDGVRIVDTAASPAEDNVIGGSRASAPGAADCGGDCNVIVVSGLAIDLQGESANVGSATGPTTITGNYIGLAAGGTALPSLGVAFGIYAERPQGTTAPGPGDVTVGGSSPAEVNVIDNGIFAMVAEGAEGLLVEGNMIGWLPASETPGSEPENGGVALIDEGVTELPEVFGNEMYVAPGAVGVESYGPGAQIIANAIFGGKTGVLTDEDDAGIGNLIEGNLIEEPTFYGVLLQNDANTVAANTIFGANKNGVITDRETPEPFPVANRIGSDSPFQENWIGESGESAISLGGEAQTTNEVLGNFGYENGGPFIELRENGGHPTNEEIKPPVLGVVQESSASGTAVPGAKIRLFGKPSTDPGSLEPMIGTAIADASGHWTATFTTKQALSGLVAATQTKAAGTPKGATSEVSAPTAAAADPVAPVTPVTGTGGNPVPAPAAPVKPKAPSVKITKGPKKSSESTTAKFVFKATPAAKAKFECKLDGAKWAKCNSPKTYKKLKVGKHTFRVRGIASGLTSAAVKYQFTVKS
jgi:hypothetical protein